MVVRRGVGGGDAGGDAVALIFLDVETTGLDPSTDHVLEVAAARVDAQLNPVEGFATVVLANSGIKLPPMDPAVRDMHTRNGLLAEIEARSGVVNAVKPLCDWLAAQPADADTSDSTIPPHTLAGNSVHFDLAFLRSCLSPADRFFKHRVLDVSSFHLARKLAGLPECGIYATTHRATDDVMAAVAQARWLLSRLVA